MRHAVLAGEVSHEELSAGSVAKSLLEAVRTALEPMDTPLLRRVINGTGIIIHTNLGRAPLAEPAVAAVAGVASGYSNLEFDLESGERGYRYEAVTGLLRELTGAEGALVVNNMRAAVLLALSVPSHRAERRWCPVGTGGNRRLASACPT